MTKERREGGKAAKGRPAHVGKKRGGAVRKPPLPSPALPSPTPYSLTCRPWGQGAHAHLRAAPTALASGGAWNRLEPVRTGSARPRTNASQRKAAALGLRIPARAGAAVGEGLRGTRPSPSLCLSARASPAPGHPESYRLWNPEADLGLGERSHGDAGTPFRTLSCPILFRAAALALRKRRSGSPQRHCCSHIFRPR